MTTQVFLRDAGTIAACDNWGLGTAAHTFTFFTAGGLTTVLPCRLSRGTPVADTAVSNTVAGAGQAILFGTQATAWITPPLDRGVTISGTITANIWGVESSMSANVQMACRVWRITSAGAVFNESTPFFDTSTFAELPTTIAAQNFTQTPISTACNKGDRLLIAPYAFAIGTMGSGFTTSMTYDGPTAAASGDSYVTFTEDFGFMSDAPPYIFETVDSGFTSILGESTSAIERRAQKVYVSGPCTVTQLLLPVARTGVPVDSLQASVQADSSGSPSGTILGSGTVLGSTLSTSIVQQTFDISDAVIASSGFYWVVLERTGSLNATQYYHWANANSNTRDPAVGRRQYTAGAWGALDNAVNMTMKVQVDSSTTYPITTAGEVDPNGGTHDSKEIWTSRGAGTTNAVTNTSAAPASPILATVSAGGNFVEWYSRGLTAFTLAGPVLINLRALESTTGANATVGVEIAVTAADGTGATVWGYTLFGTEVTASEAAYQFLVAADDLAVTTGQRIRVRVYSDDSSSTAMASALTTTVAYAGTSGGASGDTYLTFSQTLTESASSASIPVLVAADANYAGGARMSGFFEKADDDDRDFDYQYASLSTIDTAFLRAGKVQTHDIDALLSTNLTAEVVQAANQNTDPLSIASFNWAPFDYQTTPGWGAGSQLEPFASPGYDASTGFDFDQPNETASAFFSQDTGTFLLDNDISVGGQSDRAVTTTSTGSTFARGVATLVGLYNPTNQMYASFLFATSRYPSSTTKSFFQWMNGTNVQGPILKLRSTGVIGIYTDAGVLVAAGSQVVPIDTLVRLEVHMERVSDTSIATTVDVFLDPTSSTPNETIGRVEVATAGALDLVISDGPAWGNFNNGGDGWGSPGPHAIWIDEPQISTSAMPGATLQAQFPGARPSLISAAHSFDQAQFNASFDWTPFDFAIDIRSSLDTTPVFFPGAASTVTLTHSIDALILKTQTKTQSVDALILKTQTKTHLVDALLKKTNTITCSIDSLILKTQTKTHLVDALLNKTQTKTQFIDALILKTQTKTHLVDALIVITRTKTQSIDALLNKTQTKTQSIDALILKTQTKTHLVDALLKKTNSNSHLVDALLKKTQTKTQSIDALVLKTQTKTHLVDALLNKTQTKTYFIDALLKKTQTVTHSVTALLDALGYLFQSADALLKKTQTQTHSIDASIVNRFTYTHSVDAFLSSRLTKTHSIDTFLVYRLTKTQSVDALLKKTLTTGGAFNDEFGTGFDRGLSIDALLRKTQTQTQSVDALLQKTQSNTHSVDALILKTQTIAQSVDALLITATTTYTITHSVDALISQTRTKTQSIDALILKTQAQTHLIDALIKKTQTLTHAIDALILKTQTKTHLVDALLNKTQTKTQSIDALILKTQTKTHFIDVLLKKTQTQTHLIDALLKKTQAQTHLVDVLIKKTQAQTQSVDALIKQTQSKSHLIDALILKTGAATGSVDALLTKTQTKTSSVDSLIQKTQTAIHSLDALLTTAGTAFSLVDALVKKTQTNSYQLEVYIAERKYITHSVDAKIVKVRRANTFEGGIDEVAITPANSGGISGDAFEVTTT